MEYTEVTVSKPEAVIACIALALFYVAILYTPTVILRLPPPSSFKVFMIRRFISATISSFLSIMFSALFLHMRGLKISSLLGLYGIRLDHLWQAVVFPLTLTSLMYAGSVVLKLILLVSCWKDNNVSSSQENIMQKLRAQTFSVVSNVMFWRNYVVAPLTEELVFRACMIALLLCGGFGVYNIVFLCPTFFSLAHLNHVMEVYSRHNHSMLKASMAVGLQLGYTLIFGSYATFLFLRTGHLISPLVAHIFCNHMGLPVLFAQGKGVSSLIGEPSVYKEERFLLNTELVGPFGLVSLSFVAGMVAFMWSLGPLTQPELYNGT